ncbi:hypothetical protein AHiyo8_62880 [Arthrobacter sp. Hiyo8]|nr:hypothetical protein AHiyo8_62880 [Arthrobacter sp. Hiyo8]
MVNIVGVPQRLEQLVGEAQGQDVLDRLLAKVVVDAEDRVRREDGLHDVVELARGLQVVAEGLLDDHAAPLPVAGLRQPVLGELLADLLEGLGRDGQVETVIAAGAAGFVQFVQRGAEALERLVVVEFSLDEADALGELVPDGVVERGAGVRLDVLLDLVREVLVAPVRRPKPTSAKLGGSSPRLARS